jgi:diguanylate cyclase (GGDEF)-like protein
VQLYASSFEIEALEQRVASAVGRERFLALVELAWHLRQRDTRRAEKLAEEALAQVRTGDALAHARIVLTQAECALLLMRLKEATALAADARKRFAASSDAAGTGDAELVRARIAEAKGDREGELPCYRAALEAYRAADDPERIAHVRAAAMLAGGFIDAESSAAELAALRDENPEPSPALRAHLQVLEGFWAFQRGEFLRAIPALQVAAVQTYDAGLCEQGFRAEAGLVSSQSNLGDREAACIQAEAVLARARLLGWPRAIGHALANFARQLADTGQAERAVELLLEAREALADQPRARGFGIACYYLGDAYLALGRNAEALAELERASQVMRDLNAQPEVACLMAIAAQALSRLGRPEEALARAQAALELARKTRSKLWEVEALRSLAEVHSTHRKGEGDIALALRYLEQAVAVVEEIGGHHEKSQLHTEIAAAHEAAGDLARALDSERAARAEDAKEAHRRAANRLLLARERQETENQRREAELQRGRAAAESERAQLLATTLGLLEHVRQVGQDITAHLEPSGMLAALDRHLANLAPVSFIGVFVFNPAGGKLSRHGIEQGRMLPVDDVALADLESYAARVARERREIHVDQPEGGPPGARIPGTQVTRTLWFGPLLVNEELLGVLTVQTPVLNAYGQREHMIFRTVSGHVAVAFANARTHGELERKHRRLAETEAEMRRLATTDALTGLDNRRRFLASAQNEVARAMRYGGALGMVMADLDRFKTINDAGGHGAGDRVLADVAGVLRAQQRPHDVVGRLGGEEFAIVLPGASLEACMRTAERVRAAIESLSVAYQGATYQVTMSLGCASVQLEPASAGDPDEVLVDLMRRADAALYEAKRLGRNRIEQAAH